MRLTLLKGGVVAMALLALVDGAHGDASAHPPPRPSLVAIDPIDVPAGSPFDGRAFRLKYLSAVPGETPGTASGLLLVPRVVTSSVLVSYQHSSAVARDDVPTTVGTPHWNAAVTLSNAGRVVVAADYLGLGASPGMHAWLDATSEVAATKDLLEAVSAAINPLGLPVSKQVDLVGFSQGAHATLALASALIASSAPPFAVRSITGVAGPYLLSEVDVPALASGAADPMVRNLALARLTVSAGLRGASVDDMYQAGWRDRLHQLFDGSHTDDDVVRSLPSDPRQMFTPSGWADLEDPNSEFGRWLQRTSAVCGGIGQGVPVTLMHAAGDRSASPLNTVLCKQKLEAAGTPVSTVQLGGMDHIPSGRVGLLAVCEALRAQGGSSS